MPRYYHQHSQYKQRRFIRRWRRAIVILTLLLLAIVAAVLYYLWNDMRDALLPSKPTTQTTTTISTPVEVFQNEYFQFQTDKNWRFIEKESTLNSFIYRRFNKNLIEHEFSIYINTPKPDQKAAYVLPVTATNDYLLEADEVSTHCKQSLPKTATKDPLTLTHGGVQFYCTPELMLYYVIVGLKSGQAPMVLKRPNGAQATYGIYYRNLTVHNDPRELYEVMKTFQIR
jgi:uncharacterized protein YpmB